MSKHEMPQGPIWWSKMSGLGKGSIIAAVSIVAVLILVVGIVGGKAADLLSKLHRDEEFSDLNNSELGIDVELPEEIYNIALFGIDTRDPKSFKGNSDSIMILSINQTSKELKMVSIMRDSLVPIERNGSITYGKINSAYAYGEAELAVKTLNSVYNLNIQDYATVNFYGMADIIDAVGGIDVEVLQAEIDDEDFGINEMISSQCEKLGLDKKDYLVKTPGKQRLNGVQAVAYARIRKTATANGTANDFGRVERQQYVMQQLLNKALALKEWNQYLELAEALAPYVKTSLTNNDMMALAKVLSGGPTMVQTRVPGDEYIIDRDFRESGASTVYYNYEYAAEIIHAFLYDGISPEDFMAQNPVDKTPWYN